MLGPLRVSQILSIVLSAVFGGLLLYKKIKLSGGKNDDVKVDDVATESVSDKSDTNE